MPDDEECIHGLGPVSACVLCNGRADREAAISKTVVARWPALYAGRVACGHDVEVGDQLTRLGDGRIVCEECAP